MTTVSETHLDVAIIGGGIAGLWLLNRLLNEGYHVALFEAEALGSHQTVASQGMIHGGIKYALQGKRTGASESIAEMPHYWRRCLRGEGDVDLQGAKVLSDHFYLWSTDSWWSRLMTFGASLSLRGRIEKVTGKDRPELFRHKAFRGGLYRLVDMVMDVPSVVKKLADNARGRIFALNPSEAKWERNESGEVTLLLTPQQRITANQFILTAGEGNQAILTQLGLEQPAMQIRPLQQVMVRHRYPYSFYGHCVTRLQDTPRLTISSHPLADGSQVWYLGGTLAEEGVGKNAQQLIAEAKAELQQTLPWLDWESADWETLSVNRAEPAQPGGKRPDGATITSATGCTNLAVAWPTKLTLAPSLANQALTLLHHQGIEPGPHAELALGNPPPLAPTPWQNAFAQHTGH